MSGLLVVACCDEGGADRMIGDMPHLQEQHLITISDAATVVRKTDGRIRIRHVTSLIGPDAVGGVFWGLLIGFVFFTPWLGIALGSVRGALAGKLADYGLREAFIKEVGAAIGPGHSALFLMVSSVTEDKIIKTLARHRATLLRMNLSQEDENNLREAFGDAVEVEM